MLTLFLFLLFEGLGWCFITVSTMYIKKVIYPLHVRISPGFFFSFAVFAEFVLEQVIIEGFKSYKEEVSTDPFSPKVNCVGNFLSDYPLSYRCSRFSLLYALIHDLLIVLVLSWF